MKRLILTLLICLMPMWAWGATYTIDSVKGSPTGNMYVSALKPLTLTDQDSIVIIGPVKWQEMQTTDGTLQPKTAPIKGIIHHHYLPGGTARTIMVIDGQRYEGISTIGKDGEMTMKVETIKTESVQPLDEVKIEGVAK